MKYCIKKDRSNNINLGCMGYTISVVLEYFMPMSFVWIEFPESPSDVCGIDSDLSIIARNSVL